MKCGWDYSIKVIRLLIAFLFSDDIAARLHHQSAILLSLVVFLNFRHPVDSKIIRFLSYFRKAMEWLLN